MTTSLSSMNKKIKKYYCYIIECADNTLYTGYTDDLEARLKAHNEGAGAKYTRGRAPCKLVYEEEFSTKSEAMKREYFIKHKLGRSGKLALIESKKSAYDEAVKNTKRENTAFAVK